MLIKSQKPLINVKLFIIIDYKLSIIINSDNDNNNFVT